MARERRNERYVPGIDLPAALTVSSDLSEAWTARTSLVAAIPRRRCAPSWRSPPAVAPDAVVLSLAKGLESSTGLRMTQVIAEVLAEEPAPAAGTARRTCVLSGPTWPWRSPGRSLMASGGGGAGARDAAWAARCCADLRPYTNTDVVGTEIGGSRRT
ncbi:hypothetical protein QJS66_00780 [Kocuria rhizophila]|nr:hypothetical protein QJS66_00780 [Kocuria rhizophila]